MAKGNINMDKEKIEYIKNELNVLNHRRRQMKTYIQKINGIMEGMEIDEVESRYKPRPNLKIR